MIFRDGMRFYCEPGLQLVSIDPQIYGRHCWLPGGRARFVAL